MASIDPEQFLHQLIEETAHLLPAQGPIGVFVHHNTLHAFQHLPFEDALRLASETYGAEPFLSEAEYRQALTSGRIKLEDIGAVLFNDRDATAWPGMRRCELRRKILAEGVRFYHPDTAIWELEQEPSLEGYEGRALLQACLQHVPEPAVEPGKPVRPRDGILAQTGYDIDEPIHSWMIRLSAAFLDQGLAYWPMPNREQGFLRASLSILGSAPGPLSRTFAGLPELCRELAPASADALEVIHRCLIALGVPDRDWPEVIKTELLALPGWAGMMNQLEKQPELSPHEIVPASLADFLAVRMILTVAAANSLLKNAEDWRLGFTDPADAFNLRMAKVATLYDAAWKLKLETDYLGRLHAELEAFTDFERRRILHLAYERRHEREVLVPMQKHLRATPAPQPSRVSAQVFFCLDEREESIRRHLEELAPQVETFGAAGFFGAAMNYQGVDDAKTVSLCPVVVKPQHEITERPAEGQWSSYARRVRLRKLWAMAAREWQVSSKTVVRGWIGTAVLGVFNIVPMTARILSPRQYSRLIAWLNASILPEPRTELAFERSETDGPQDTFSLAKGFTVEEKADRVAAVLGNAGLRRGMARLVVILGHGSSSVNNPHESAYNCGACGGRRGGPNARLFAAMANHPAVRAALRKRNVVISDDTWFVGGMHDTCTDDVTLYDLANVPQTHRSDLAQFRAVLDQARARNAHERIRRFSGTDGLDAADGLRHVQERGEHLAEARPEYGHSTNAICILGRREWTRGLFLDRRAFLTSYDAAQDPRDEALAAQLGAVVPVCAGINLEYYFSRVDNERYGCGTKLPHNVSGLLGVMNGYEGDLRTGLTWQMVEIHEPVRILFVIESTPERILKTFEKNPMLWEFLSNRWIRLAALDAKTGNIDVYRDGVWEPLEGGEERLGKAASSQEWYRGRMEHLGVARIEVGSR